MHESLSVGLNLEVRQQLFALTDQNTRCAWIRNKQAQRVNRVQGQIDGRYIAPALAAIDIMQQRYQTTLYQNRVAWRADQRTQWVHLQHGKEAAVAA